jgi:TANFOR domain-containing protein
MEVDLNKRRFMKYFYQFCFILFTIAGISGHLQAQNFGVQATTQIRPPYSLYLSDYVAPGSNSLSLNLLLTELNRSNYRVKLRLTIEGVGVTITTKSNFLPNPITLQGGVPEILMGTDLAEYFNPNNLEFRGLTLQKYQQGGGLPEGLYRICIEVLDYNVSKVVSGQACATAWMVLNDPPFINMPQDNVKIKAMEPQNVIFQWTPRHTGSPNSAFTTEYKFKIVEIWPEGRNPNDAILSGNPLYETTTTNTALIYSISEPSLVPGRQYAYRIQARDTEGRDLFKNQGYSEVRMFTYGDECKMPLKITAETSNSRRIKITWRPENVHTGYTVRYREEGKKGAEWFEKDTYLNYLDINSLKPQTTYEYQVKGMCGTIKSDYSLQQTITTPETSSNEFSCGASVPGVNLDDTSLKPSLNVGEIISAGDFEVKITKISGNNGIFSGEGQVVVPFMNYAKVKTKFSNIKVNNDSRLIDGKIMITGTTVQVVTDEVREDFSDLLADVDATFNDVDEYLDKVDELEDKVEEFLAEVEELKEEVREVLEQAQQLIAKGKELIKSGDTEEGQALVEQGKKQIDKGLEDAGDIPDYAPASKIEGYDTMFGPLAVKFNETRQPTSTDSEGFSTYEKVSSSFILTMEGTVKKEVTINNAVISYKMNIETKEYKDVNISWLSNDGGVDIGSIQFISANVTGVNLKISSDHTISGDVTLQAYLNEDKQLQKSVILRKGLEGKFSFGFSGGQDFTGFFNFQGVKNINLDLEKDMKVLASFKDGVLNSSGTLSGTIKTNSPVSYTSNAFNVILNSFESGLSLSMNEGLKLNNGKGSVTISGMTGVQGKITLGLTYNNDGLVSQITDTDLSAFGMSLSDLNLKASFDENFDFHELTGSFNAKHEKFNTKLKISDFLVSNGALVNFNASGNITYNDLSLKLIRSSYKDDKLDITASASVAHEAAAGESTSEYASASVLVDGFTIDQQGVVTMGALSGDFDSGEMFGPLRVTFNVPPQTNGPDADGFCGYEDVTASFILKMKNQGGEENEIAVRDAKMSYKKHCETGEFKDVNIQWADSEGISVGDIGIISAKTTAINLDINGEGKISGKIGLEASLTADKKISDILLLHKGVKGDFSFSFTNSDDFSGDFDFSNLSGINIDMIKGTTVIATIQNGMLNSKGVLDGVFNAEREVSYNAKGFKITMKELSLGFQWSTLTNDFSFKDGGNGKIVVSEIKGVEGAFGVKLSYFQKKFTAGVSTEGTDAKAFGMTLKDMALSVEFDNNFNVSVFEGSMKAKHSHFNAAITVREFKVVEGELKTFNANGLVKYKDFKFNIKNAKYANNALVVSASTQLNITSPSASLDVDKFTISPTGEVSIGKIAGDLSVKPLSLTFDAEFNKNEFKGDFSGDVAELIGLSGEVNIGAKDDYNYSYYEIEAKTQVPIGATGLKLTRLGGQIGFNYGLTYKTAGEAPIGAPEKNRNLAGFTLGIGDIANLFEVVGNPVVQLGEEETELNLNGSLTAPVSNPIFRGNLNVNYKLPSHALDGSVGMNISIPSSSGYVFKTENILLNYYAADGKWGVEGSNMTASLFTAVNFVGNVDFNSTMSASGSAITGHVSGMASYEYSTTFNQVIFVGNMEASINLGFNSHIEANLNESGLSGEFGVALNGAGSITITTGFSETTVAASAQCNAMISYYNSIAKIQGELDLAVQSTLWNGEVSFNIEKEIYDAN